MLLCPRLHTFAQFFSPLRCMLLQKLNFLGQRRQCFLFARLVNRTQPLLSVLFRKGLPLPCIRPAHLHSLFQCCIMYAKAMKEHFIFSQMELFFLHGQVVKNPFTVKAADALHPNQQCLLCFLMVIADCFPCRIVNILKRMQKCLEGLGLLFPLQRLDHLFQPFFC